ncbi:MAG: biotin--[acetyl-CoA-carboxylase] ligase [Helicobacteraceae bacterium]|nr:biotin--[acetyl-CoA-carboxylase] ligase [Helicobacteraceae bacterium]
MQILSFESLDSTQTYLLKNLKNKTLESPIAIVSDSQTSGLGSRGNSWDSNEGNLFLSFALKRNSLPNDLKLESSSIYFAYILKEILQKLGSKLWLKWPNDFYINDKKVGGVITNISADNLVCGIGLNLNNSKDTFTSLDIQIDREYLLNLYFNELKKFPIWKQIFSKFEIEFHNNKNFSTHIENELVILKNAKLLEDGSLEVNNKKVFSLR